MCFEQLLCLLIAAVTFVVVLVLRRSALRDAPAPTEGLGGLAWVPITVVLVIGSVLVSYDRRQPGSGHTEQIIEPLVAKEGPSARKKLDVLTVPVSEYQIEFILASLLLPLIGVSGIAKLYSDVQRGVLKSSRKTWGLLDNGKRVVMLSAETDPISFWGQATLLLLVWLLFLSFGLISVYRLLDFWFRGNG